MLIDPARLTDIVARMISGTGSSEAEGRAVAENLVQANLMGHDSHGVGLAPRYMHHAWIGTLTPNASSELITDSGVMALHDGNMGYGQVIGPEVMTDTIQRAKEHGAAIAGLRNVHHLGRIGAWGEMCAKAGLISIHYVNGIGHRAYVAPWGGREARTSTNPYCTAIPATSKNPMIVLDMATSRVAQGKTRVAYYKEVDLPMDDAVIGPDGRQTASPKSIFEEPYGAMLPFGQHKGYGLSMICEILAGALTGGGAANPKSLGGETINNGMLTIAIDPSRMGDVPFAEEIDNLVEWITSSATADGVDKVRFPGDPEREMTAQRMADGIPVDPNTWAEMTEAGVKAGMSESDFA